MSPDRGDVVLVLFPDSSLRTSKRRPALVVQSNNLNTGLPQVIVAMITSQMHRAGHPSRIQVMRSSALGRTAGIKTDSIIMTDNLATVRINEIDQKIGSFTDTSALNAALRHTLGL